MSVIVSKRQHSEVEYIHKAQQLIFFLIDRLDKYERKLEKNKKYKHLTKSIYYSLWNQPIYNAQMIYDYCLLANKIKIKDLNTYNKRKEYLEKALNSLYLLETSITSLYELANKVIKDKFLILLVEKIDEENKLINGVLRSDKSNINDNI